MAAERETPPIRTTESGPTADGTQPPAPLLTPIERAIVVDDDLVIRSILRSTLAGIGLGVHLAADGDEAITMAKRHIVGLFMLDLQMPGTNGLETCRQLRALPQYANTPIVVLTGHDGARAHEAALAAGATMFLTKPFKPAILLRALAPLISGRMPGGEPAADNPVAPADDLWGQADPEYRNQLWGRLDAQRAMARRVLGENDLGLD
jgi:CheY-like chemotaxis protein